MKLAIKFIRIFLASLVLSLITFQANSYAGRGGFGAFNSFPGPQLVYPITNDIVLSGKDSLEFKWLCRDITRTDYYDFRLYRGYNMVESTLIIKKDIPGGTCSFELSKDSFEENQIYTWSLKRVLFSGGKSDRSFSSFKIIRK